MSIRYFKSKVALDGNRETITNIIYDDVIGLVLVPATLWLIDLVSDPTFEHENNDTAAKGLRSYFQFLEDNEMHWDIFPRTKIERPTYAYKRFMISKVKLCDYSYSTGNQFLGVVKRFYLWANRENLINFTSINAPFIIDQQEMQKDTRVGRKGFSIATSDMRLPRKLNNTNRENGPRDLKPLNKESRSVLSAGLDILNKHHLTLCCQLSLLSGLREEETLTLPYDEFYGEKSSQRLIDGQTVTLRIGGNDGTKTKNGVVRDIDIPFLLYEKLCDYAGSEKRLHYGRKSDAEKQKLFLNNRGKPFDAEELTKRTSELRILISDKIGITFDHKYHDLRCTYATEFGSRLLSSGMDYVTAFNELKARLGHSLDKDTARYMRIVEGRRSRRQSAIELEKYTQEVLLSDD
jgi:site-specific recombinase XerD